MRSLDFSSWSALVSTLLGLAVITLLGVGIRLLVMQSVQQRRERENRQINERLRTLIAAYKTLGGSFTGISSARCWICNPYPLMFPCRNKDRSGRLQHAVGARATAAKRMAPKTRAAMREPVLEWAWV
jgi:heme exporter protein D